MMCIWYQPYCIPPASCQDRFFLVCAFLREPTRWHTGVRLYVRWSSAVNNSRLDKSQTGSLSLLQIFQEREKSSQLCFLCTKDCYASSFFAYLRPGFAPLWVCESARRVPVLDSAGPGWVIEAAMTLRLWFKKSKTMLPNGTPVQGPDGTRWNLQLNFVWDTYSGHTYQKRLFYGPVLQGMKGVSFALTG